MRSFVNKGTVNYMVPYATERERLMAESYLFACKGFIWWSKLARDEAGESQ